MVVSHRLCRSTVFKVYETESVSAMGYVALSSTGLLQTMIAIIHVVCVILCDVVRYYFPFQTQGNKKKDFPSCIQISQNYFCPLCHYVAAISA